MKTLNMETATKRYNDLMYDLCLDHLTIGTSSSEETAGWNLRDMISEAQYQLDLYYEESSLANEMRYSDNSEERAIWKSESGMLRRFIKAYQPFVKEMKCTAGHCSKWDNHRS